ncbi:MAG: transcriptional regulator [Burkholderiaceae bacterium]
MPLTTNDLPIGHSSDSETLIRSSAELGAVIRDQRKRLTLTQLDLAGLGNTGNRFVVDLESGKPTVQLQKVLDLMGLLGLELVVRTKASRSAPTL